MSSEINAAWRRSDKRLALAESFIDVTEPIEKSDLEQVYASRVLLLYAACQYAVQELGDTCTQVLARSHRSPSSLPLRVRQLHIDSSVGKLSPDKSAADWQERVRALSGLTGVQWSQYTKLNILDGNVWPDRIVSYLRSFTEANPDFNWMRDAKNSDGETLQSRLRSLVEERNPIAHGHLAGSVASADLMRAWKSDCTDFLRRVYLSMSAAMFDELPRRTVKVGLRDRNITLGSNTMALKVLTAPLNVGDIVILRARSSEARAAQVLSLMSHGDSLENAPEGGSQVAVQLSKSVGRAELYQAP